MGPSKADDCDKYDNVKKYDRCTFVHVVDRKVVGKEIRGVITKRVQMKTEGAMYVFDVKSAFAFVSTEFSMVTIYSYIRPP